MTNAQDRGWGTGWSQCQTNKIVTLVRSDGLRLPVRAEMIDLYSMLIDLTETMGYDVLPGETWGFACRAISGTTTASNHSWGLAIDINAPSNPQSYTFITNIPVAVQDLWKNHGFRWGGDYKPPTKYDPMHMEFLGTPADAARITQELRTFISKPTTPVQEDTSMEADFIYRLYMSYFKVLDLGGFNYWLDILLKGAKSKNDIRHEFAKVAGLEA